MSTPPSEYFPGIKFNLAFYTTGEQYATIDYCNQNFLRASGYAVSRAISTTFNNIVYFNGGFEVIGNITVNGDVSANNFKGSGAQLTSLNASNVTDGTLPVARGGTGSNTLASGQLLIGNGLNPLTQTSGLTWSSNTLTAANITTGLLNSTNEITTNLTTTFMSGFKNTFYPLAFQNICSSTNLTKSVGADTDTVKTVYTTFGTHTLTATSVNATNSKIENIFDNNSSTYWTTATATYTRLSVDANYTANSSFSVNVTSLGVVYGQSIKVRLPRRIYLKDVLYIPFSLPTSITNGYMLGSTNDSTWEPVYPITKFLTNLNEVSLVPTGILPAIYNGSSKAYQYFMIIATSIQGTTGAPINSTEKFAITNLQFTLNDNWVYHDNIISIGSFPNGVPISNALDINGNTYISGKIFTDGGLNVLNGNVGIGLTNPNVSYKLDVSGNINALSYTVNGVPLGNQWTYSGSNIYYNTGNVGIGATTTSDVDDNTAFAIPTATLYVKGGATTGGTCNVSFRGGVAGQNNGKARLWLVGDASHSSYIESEHTGSGNTYLSFGTANGNALPVERMRIGTNGNLSIGSTDTATYKLNVNGNSFFNGVLNHNTQYYGGGADFACNKFNLWGTGGNYGFGISGGTLDYFTSTYHRFLWGGGGTNLGTVGMTLTNNNLNVVGNITCANLNCNSSYVLGTEVYARNSYDTRIRSDSGGMYLEMGYIGTGGSLLSLGAFGGNTEIVSGASRAIVMRTAGYNWLFVGASSYNPANSSYWNTVSDHRIKENIKKANLKICYNNIKNINLYRFNYIDAVGNATQHDKTQLGFIAQQVKQHYPKSVKKEKRRLEDKREIPDLLNVDVNQVNLTLFGAVKQLIRVVEKQSKRIKKLEELLNIIDDDDIEDDADEPYIKIECDEIDINTIEPSEPEGV